MLSDEQAQQIQCCQQQMQRQGVRRLLVLSGSASWSLSQAQAIAALLPGDWQWVGDDNEGNNNFVASSVAQRLLGQEFLHGVFDARYGFNAEALAAFSGTLKAGSWLLLLVPDKQTWPQQADSDSLRWSEQPQAIATPNFVYRFCAGLLADNTCTFWQQNTPLSLSLLPAAEQWQLPSGVPTARQQQVLAQLQSASSGVYVLTAARGRGKSWLTGYFAQHHSGSCWFTAPNKTLLEPVLQQAGGPAQFWAPDALLAHCEAGHAPTADWLIIDEAAAIPSPLLTRLLAFFSRVLLVTTVQGYEGTGRGFLLKFCASLPQWHDLRLDDPIRWAKGCPLESLLDRLLLLTEPVEITATAHHNGSIALQTLTHNDWQLPGVLESFYGLLTSAHYRTSPLDLRRILDAPGGTYAQASLDGQICAAIWLVAEGELEPALVHEVWAGRRRPRGNLVAQSLAAHAGFPEAAILSSRRISRIAVVSALRRQGIAQRLIDQQIALARQEGLDYLSVSFGYTEPLWALWRHCGFRLVRIGSQLEASSGCYAAMALLPLSAAGQQIAADAQRQLARDWHWLQKIIRLDLVLDEATDQRLNEADWRELSGFAFAHRALESSYAALQRLLLVSHLPLPALRQHLQSGLSPAECVENLALSGRKALLRLLREESAQALHSLDATACGRWQQFVKPLDR